MGERHRAPSASAGILAFWTWVPVKPFYALWWFAVGFVTFGWSWILSSAMGETFHAWAVAFVVFVLGALPILAIRAGVAFDELCRVLREVVKEPEAFDADLRSLRATFFSAQSRWVQTAGIGNGLLTAGAAWSLGMPFSSPAFDAVALALIAVVGVFCGIAAVQVLGLFALGHRLPRLAVDVSFGNRCDRAVAELRRCATRLSLVVLAGYVLFYLALRAGPFPIGAATPWLAVWGLLPLGVVVWGALQIQGFQRAVKFANLDRLDQMLRTAHARAAADPSPPNIEQQRMLLEQRALIRAEPFGFSLGGASAFVMSALAAMTQIVLQITELRNAVAGLLP